MNFNIPSIGSLIVLTEDWNISDVMHARCSMCQLSNYKDCTQIRELKGTPPKTWEQTRISGAFTFPKGTIFRIDSIDLVRLRDKMRYSHLTDSMSFTVIESPLAHVCDDAVVLTKTGRISKKKKERSSVSFSVAHTLFKHMQFDFTI